MENGRRNNMNKGSKVGQFQVCILIWLECIVHEGEQWETRLEFEYPVKEYGL